MASQIVGYKYFTNFLLFIGNPIENLMGINFDKRGWLTGRRVSMGENGTMIYLHSPNLYGENEGGVSGTLCFKQGTNNQYPDASYKKYMESIGSQASGYPFQSYISFGGGELIENLEYLTDEQLQALADQYNDGVIPGNGFYVGNSGYMKEMLLWLKRIHVRNDGRAQWYDLKSEVPYAAFQDSYESEQVAIDAINRVRMNGSIQSLLHVVGGNGYNFNFNEAITDGLVWVLSNLHPDYKSTSSNGISITVNYVAEPKIIIEIKVVSIGSLLLIGTDFIILSDSGSIPIDNNNYFEYERRLKLQFSTSKAFLTMRVAGDDFSELKGRLQMQIDAPIFSYGKLPLVNSGDINPIHKIREILTDDTAMNKPETSVNSENFVKAADQIWDEGLGISWSITEKSCIDAINELCYHIEAGIRVNRQTGLYEMVLFRDDWFEEDEIHNISESKIKSMQYEITNADEVINQVNVNYYDRANIKNSSFSISESGLIQTLGRVNVETVDFPYFMNMRNAEIVANWKLKLLSTGVYKGSFTTGWRAARKWNRYDLIRLPWSKRWVGTILVRIMSINLGSLTNNEVSIEFVEVVPSTGMMNTTIVADEVINKPLPPQACQYEPFEMPYYLAVMVLGQRKADEELAYESNFGLVGVVAEKPQENSLYAVMLTNNYDEWVRAGSIEYSATADLDQIISKTSSSFTVNNWKKISNVPVGTLIQCGKEWLTGLSEWMVFQGIDPNTGVVSVKRGALDTQPQDWDLGLKLYFCGTDISYDQTEYVYGEKVLVSALTTTPSGVLEQKGSNQVEMKARAIRPYPPANVKINGEYWNETHIISSAIILTWSHRNRVQQTGGESIGWYASSVTVEVGVTYSVEISSGNAVLHSASNINADTYTIPASALKPNETHTLKIWSVRDNYESYQKFDHSFFVKSASLILTATATKSNVTGNTVPTANITVNVDESLKANMRFDGSSISGKAPAGSTITIEVNE